VKKIVIVILSLSICLASGKHQKQLEKLMKSLQDQYQIYGPEDLHKLKSKSSAANRTSSSRDMSDIVGEWYLDHNNIGMYVTVGTDQSIINWTALMGLDLAEGGITATHNDWETQLNYLLDASFMEGDDDYYGYDYDPIGDNDDDYYRNADALTYAQDYVDENSSQYDQSTFDLVTEFSLTVDGDNVTGGLGGDNPENCEINWPEDPYRMAVYSFVSEYVLEEGGSVGCFVDSDTLDQTYEDVALDMESGWTGGGGDDDYTVCGGMSSDDPDWVCCDCDCMDYDDMECLADDEDCLENLVCDDDDEDGGPELMIMNFDFMNFFMFMFGIAPEGVDNPLIVMVGFEEGIVMAQGLAAFGEDPDIYFANPSDFASYITVDTIESTITFSQLDLIDTTGAVALRLNGTIGPGMIDLVAGVETELPFPAILNEADQEEMYMTFFEDSTGIEVQIYEDYYYEEVADTSEFDWYATSDSLYMLFEDEEDWEPTFYEFSGDTMIISGEDYPCDDDYYYYTMDECMEEISEELPMLVGLEDVDDFYVHGEQIMIPAGDDEVSISPDASTLPKKFALYPAYPNPFNPVTTIRFDVGDATADITSLRIYDITGRNVATLVNEQMDSGNYELNWNASGHPSGIYFSELISGSTRLTQKMVLLK